ncbi:UNVERIFIED_CONTAM: hypothetical protein FKN15_038968 [Acipenser sinensis]
MRNFWPQLGGGLVVRWLQKRVLIPGRFKSLLSHCLTVHVTLSKSLNLLVLRPSDET